MQEPSAYQFDRHNAYWKADGTRGAPLEDFYDLKKYDDEAAEGAPLVGGGRKKRVSVDSDMRLTNMVNSVWLADGIHHQISDGHMDQLPDRYDPSSFRDKVTWFGALCISGLGMFLEGMLLVKPFDAYQSLSAFASPSFVAYIIITIGQVKTIWEAEYPTCWAPDTKQHCPNLIDCCDLFPNTPIFPNGTCAVDPDPRECNADGTYKSNLLCNPGIDNSLSYTEFAGIMIGMLVFGKVADLIGRVRAGMATSLLMVIGLIFITFYDSDNLSQQFIIISAFLGVVGIGIGGEYPLTAMGASANHAEEVEDALMDDEERARHRVLVDMARTARRGETISLVFAMQGVGTVFGSAYLLFLIYFSRNLHVDW